MAVPPINEAEVKYEKSCGTVAFRQGENGREFLLLRYPEGHWDFPKGHVENGEEEIDTALRELREETGIVNAAVLEGFRYPIRYRFYADFEDLKGWIDKTVVFFVCEVLSKKETVLSHEHHDFMWVSEAETMNKITYDNAKEMFARALEYMNSGMDLVERARTGSSALYELSSRGLVERFILTTPESRRVTNDPRCCGVEYTDALKKSMETCFTLMKSAGKFEAEEEHSIILNILRGGLNFGLREALHASLGWNVHRSSFLSSQRVYDKKDGWYITENRYQKIELGKTADIICADVVATGVSLKHALLHLVNVAKERGCNVRNIIFITIGSVKTEELLEEIALKCKEFFPVFRGVKLLYLEGVFGVAREGSRLSVALQGTDLVRYPALLAPEFVESQKEEDSFALERCTIYDAGSRAYDVHEYLSDVREYWTQVKTLGDNGMSVKEYLLERFPHDDRLKDASWCESHSESGSLASLATSVLSHL